MNICLQQSKKKVFATAFVDYSDFDEIEDEEFHRLRKAFVEAKEALEKYIEN